MRGLVDNRFRQLREKPLNFDPGRNVANSATNSIDDSNVAFGAEISTHLESISLPLVDEEAQVQNETARKFDAFRHLHKLTHPPLS